MGCVCSTYNWQKKKAKQNQFFLHYLAAPYLQIVKVDVVLQSLLAVVSCSPVALLLQGGLGLLLRPEVARSWLLANNQLVLSHPAIFFWSFFYFVFFTAFLGYCLAFFFYVSSNPALQNVMVQFKQLMLCLDVFICCGGF